MINLYDLVIIWTKCDLKSHRHNVDFMEIHLQYITCTAPIPLPKIIDKNEKIGYMWTYLFSLPSAPQEKFPGTHFMKMIPFS